MSKTIATENAPAAIGPYVQGVDLGSMVITSGQIPVDPKTGSVPKDVSAQARQSLENVKAIVEAAGPESRRHRENDRIRKRSERLCDRQRHLRSLLH
ncbi:Endoribonuclease L-PSP [Salmonella enterica subsp. arizonae]|uniref:Endoribonuclease L-PSP n=1 Tax=Salmonella enterica subsp. arizonae TaxID=59203 RepID=A0A379THE9_SALER|nr:Endoribonuclease L-PSP [Salmonella enterica subsp. arizonae]